MDEIKKILEAVQNGEITAEEAETLILAIKEKEKIEQEKTKKSIFEEEQIEREENEPLSGEKIIIREDEEFEGDINLVSGEAIIRGTVKGDVSIVMGKLEFSGEITGDLNVVGSKVKWNGGAIYGSLNVVGCKESGKMPKVKKGITRVNNVFMRGLFRVFLKPILSGIEVKNGNFVRKKWNFGKNKVQKYEKLIVKKGEFLNITDDIKAEEIVVDGKLICSNIFAERFVISGEVSGGNISVEELVLTDEGVLKCGNLNVEKIIVDENASIKCGNISAEDIYLNGTISAGFVNCEHLSGKGQLNSGGLSCEENELRR